MVPKQEFEKTTSIQQVSLAQALDLPQLFDLLKDWLDSKPKAFRLDGHNAIGPANPTQLIFFNLSEFPAKSFSGEEEGEGVTGSKWNGTYFLTASCRREAVEEFVSLYKKHRGDLGSIFRPGYTSGKEGQPNKRRLFLQASDEINVGWNCKQYIRRYSNRI